MSSLRTLLMQLSQPTLEPHSLCYTCWVQVVYSLLPLLYFFLLATLLLLSSCRHEGVRSVLPGLRGLLGVRLPVDVPVAPCFSFGELYSYFVPRFRCIRHFVIIVINNIRIRFIISYSWYVLWYTVHSVVYTCDLILARIWLLGLCSFINRVLQSGIRAISTVGRSLDRTGRVLGLLLSNPCLLKLFYYYTPWLLWLFTRLALISLSEE